ncbi:MAG TPA: hypothetical protein VJ142_00775 [Candidatus Nanoarchaeia archaeon]|nr:hypothetical protein [Candidatus Nanoarchaeia archaeon]
MTKLEDLKGRTITNVRVMPNTPPEETGQLELTLDNGSILEFNLEREGYKGLRHYAVVRINGQEVYKEEKPSD